MKVEFSGQIFQNDHVSVSSFMKIRKAELFHADGRTGGRMDRQTDRHDEVYSLVLHFCDGAKQRSPMSLAHFSPGCSGLLIIATEELSCSCQELPNLAALLNESFLSPPSP